MARIADEEIKRIKQEVPLAPLVEAHGVKLEKKGKDLMGLCPFHDDKNPSLVISPDKNLWNCLGACQEGGSVIDWIMKTQQLSFRHAVEVLRDMTGTKPGASLPKAPKLDPMFQSDTESQKLLNDYVEFCRKTLAENSEGIAYLEKRNLKHPDMIDHFKLGLSNRTLGYRLPNKRQKSGQQVRSRLQEIGIIRSSGHEHFSGSLVIPVFDEKGNAVEIYGRKITSKPPKGAQLHNYLPGPHRGVWNISALAASKEIILCEALIDGLTFWCYGFTNVTSSYGVNGFTQEHMEAFKRYGTQRLLIAYDSDDAGDRAAVKLAEKLVEQGIQCFRLRFPRGMDANNYARQLQEPQTIKKAFDNLIKNAHWMGGKSQPLKQIPLLMETLSTPESQPAAKEETKPHSNADTSVLPPAPRCDIQAQVKDEEIIILLEPRRWRIRGLTKNMSHEILKVNLSVYSGEDFHVDTLNLYSARHRAIFIKQTAQELQLKEEVVKKELGKVMLKLEELQDEQIKKALEPKKKEVRLNEEEKKAALELLRDPHLVDRILDDFHACGVVGEENNKLVGYISAVSRKMGMPLAIIIQSSSAAGKTSLMEAILSFVPAEERVKYSAMTGQSLFYLGETDIKHKILAIVEEEGAQRASYALKLLQSEGELSIASTGKDPATGRLITREYRVEGPVMIFITTTNVDIDEELQNRCIVLTVNESREQTRAIHHLQRQRRTLTGLNAKKKKSRILKLHHNAQRLLQPLSVVNHYAPQLTFLDDRTRTRRDHEKYLSLIESIALLHQFQRTVKTMHSDGQAVRYINVNIQDIEMANRLASEILGRSLDELPPQTRKLLLIIEELVDKECRSLKIERQYFRFSRRKIREYCGWGNTQLKIHLKRLEDMEYLIVHRGTRGQTYEYELLYDGGGKDGNAFLMGLIDVEKLRRKEKKRSYPEKKSGQIAQLSGAGRPLVGELPGGGRTELNPFEKSVLLWFSITLLEKAYKALRKKEYATATNIAAKQEKGANREGR